MRYLIIIFKVINTNIWLRRLLFTSCGAVAGFVYFTFIGCYGGNCPLTGNPYVMTGYGAIVGIILSQKR